MSSDNWTFLAIMISLIVAAIMHSNSKAENLFRSTPRSYERKSIGPVYTKELERKLIKAEALRPTGPFVVLHAIAYPPGGDNTTTVLLGATSGSVAVFRAGDPAYVALCDGDGVAYTPECRGSPRGGRLPYWPEKRMIDARKRAALTEINRGVIPAGWDCRGPGGQAGNPHPASQPPAAGRRTRTFTRT